MPESQQPASVGNQGPVTMDPNTVTEPLLAQASPSPTPKRRRAPAKRKPRTRAKAAGTPRTDAHFAAAKTLPPTDLYDRVEQRIRNSGSYMRDNVMNAVVASGVVLLIVLAHWATQQEILTASQAVVVEVPSVVELAPAEVEALPVEIAPATEPITATATVEEPTVPPPAESQPAAESPPPDVTATTPPEVEKPVVDDMPAQPVVPTGTVIEASVSIRAPLDPTKPPPAVEPVAEAMPPAPTPPPVVKRAPVARRRVRVTAARAPSLLNDPYTNGGAMDLDAPTVRQQYLQQNQTMKSLSASRTE